MSNTKQIPLRLRRRRDGTMCLTDGQGSPAGADRVFPARHEFGLAWLFGPYGSLVARIEADGLFLEMANGRAAYRIIKRGESALTCELVAAELFNPPEIDEAEAERLAHERSVAERDAAVVAARKLLAEAEEG